VSPSYEESHRLLKALLLHEKDIRIEGGDEKDADPALGERLKDGGG
jgi:hypothetical protein